VTLNDLAVSVNWVFGLVIEDDKVLELAVAAARQFATWGDLSGVAPDSADELAAINDSLPIAPAEWGVIKPLFMLYVERENARALEASRMQGVDVYGRDVNSIEGDIRQYETVDLPRLAFSAVPESI
jgi:hypothetical protein